MKILIGLLNMGEHREALSDRISTGMKQRLSLTQYLLDDPEILFLDEPTLGFDPGAVVLIRESAIGTDMSSGRRQGVVIVPRNV